MPRDVQDSCMRMPLGVRFNAQMNYGQRTAKSELEVKNPEKIVRTCQVRKVILCILPREHVDRSRRSTVPHQACAE